MNRLKNTYIVFGNGEAMPIEAWSPEEAKREAALHMKCEAGPLRCIDATGNWTLLNVVREVAERHTKKEGATRRHRKR